MSSSLILRLAAILIAATAAASPAGAQGFDLFHRSAPQTAQMAPPSDVPDGSVQQEENQAAALVVRVNRLEEQLRQANGRIEELENAQRRLEEELQKFRQDVEFRFGDRTGGAPLAAAAPARRRAPPSAVAVAPPVVIDGSAPPRPRRSDAFDPNADPNAPGAPRPLGTTPPSAPLASAAARERGSRPFRQRRGGRAARTRRRSAAGSPPATGPTIVNSGVAILDGPRDQYNAALQAFQSGQFQQAEDGFKAFITANPGHRLTPDADLLRRGDLFPALASARGRRAISQGHDRFRQIEPCAREHGPARPDPRRARQQGSGLRDVRRVRQALPDRDGLGEAPRRPRNVEEPLLSAAGAEPLSDARIDALLAPLAAAKATLIAVSGGPDSTALLLMAAGWAARRGAARVRRDRRPSA